MRKLLISVVFAFALLTTPLFANDFYGQDSFEVPQGFSLGITANFGGCTGKCGEGLEPGAGIGLSIGYRASSSFGLYVEGMKNFVHPAEGDVDNINVSFIQANIGANFYLFPASKFQPLITFGLGHAQKTWENDNGVELDASVVEETVFLGFGGEYIISDKMTIPFKLQYSKVFINDNNDTSKDSLWNILVGFNFYF